MRKVSGSMEEDKTIGDKVVEFFESAVLFLALFDVYNWALLLMAFSISLLGLDIIYGFLTPKREEEVFKKYMNFPLLLIAFYILFGAYSSLKLALMLTGYAFLRVFHAYIRRWVYDRKMPEVWKENSKG